MVNQSDTPADWWKDSGGVASLASLFSEPTPIEVGEKLLRLKLSSGVTVLMSVTEIATVATVAITDILPVPQMPSMVLGIYNWRGEMLWLVDLGQQVGLPPLLQQSQFQQERRKTVMVVVVQLDDRSIGLVVDDVADIEYHDTQQLQPAAPGLFPAKLLPFVKGYLPGDRTALLQTIALLQDPLLQIHQDVRRSVTHSD